MTSSKRNTGDGALLLAEQDGTTRKRGEHTPWPAAPRLALGLAALSSLTAAVAGLPLAWDGSYLMFRVLNEQQPYAPHDRLLQILLESPVLLVGQSTDDLGLLRIVFSLPYAFVPVASLLLCWLVVRRHRPELFVWPMLGIGLVQLPGLAFFITEAPMATELSWPLMLAALAPTGAAVLAMCAVLGVLVALSHPLAVPLLLAVGLIGAIVRCDTPVAAMRWSAGFVALAGLSVVTLIARFDAFELESVKPSTAATTLLSGVVGLPMVAVPLSLVAALYVLRAPRSATVAGRVRRRSLALTSIGLVAATLLLWASSPEWWARELDFRHWPIALTLALFGLAWFDARGSRPSIGPLAMWEGRRGICRATAAVMFAVLLVQSAAWAQLSSRLLIAVAGGSGCVGAAAIEGFTGTALEHWAVAPYSILLQARDVHAFVVPAMTCEPTSWPSEAPMGPVPALVPEWFRFR